MVILPCYTPESMYCYSSLFVLDGECRLCLLLNPVTSCLADRANPSSSCLKAGNRIRNKAGDSSSRSCRNLVKACSSRQSPVTSTLALGICRFLSFT